MQQNTRGVVLNRHMVRLVTNLHKAIYRLTGGVIGGLVMGVPNLLLTTVGRRSGRRFTTPLFYLPKGSSMIVVGSYGGHPRDPQWWQNLQANGQGWVQTGSHHWKVTAELASPELKEEYWKAFCRYYPGYQQYQANTDRVIPLVVLHPVEE